MDGSPESRQLYSKRRLGQLSDGLSGVAEALESEQLCVYATGSYGRLEAWEESDIDLFFLHEGTEPLSYLTFIRVAALLIEITTEMRFPPFSGDGRYLEALDVRDMERVLGSREDDSTNAFTARMLLLLESQPVSDPGRYERLIEQVVGYYFRDFEGREDTFVPTFLMNDILRFWRTLTLNYEHDRIKVRDLPSGEQRDREKAKSSLKNFKLKVSRLATCFSMVLHLAHDEVPVRADRVVQLCLMTPQERFSNLRGGSDRAEELLDELVEHYARFLASVQCSDGDLLRAFSDGDSRGALLADAAGYGDRIFALIRELVPEQRMRALVV